MRGPIRFTERDSVRRDRHGRLELFHDRVGTVEGRESRVAPGVHRRDARVLEVGRLAGFDVGGRESPSGPDSAAGGDRSIGVRANLGGTAHRDHPGRSSEARVVIYQG